MISTKRFVQAGFMAMLLGAGAVLASGSALAADAAKPAAAAVDTSGPSQLIESASRLFVTKMLQQTDFIAVVPTEVARYYATYGMVALLPMQLSCTMDAFGIITRTDWLLSPAATVLLRALKTSAVSSYGCTLDTKNVA